MEKLFEEFLDHSSKLRPDYPSSIGATGNSSLDEPSFIKSDSVPALLNTIYLKAIGTVRNIQDQKLMDFIPGYRLIHITELQESSDSLRELSSNNELYPFLANYSSDYICVLNDSIYLFSHDDSSLTKMCSSGEDFLKTICSFYENKVYFLDQDGYLDYDYEKEGFYGSKINHDSEYW